MMIYKNTKKGGFAVGSNFLTPENIKAGGIAVLALGILSLLLAKFPKVRRLLVLLLPMLFKASKSAVVQSGLNGIKNMANSDTLTEESQYIEVVPATPISNEEEVYDHI